MTIQPQGTLTPDGAIILDAKPALPPGRVSVRVEPLEIAPQGRGWPPGYSDVFNSIDDSTLTVHPQPPMPPALPGQTKADWDAAMKAASEIEDYDFDAFQRQRDYDLLHAKDHLP
jgi:hypothetical protein